MLWLSVGYPTQAAIFLDVFVSSLLPFEYFKMTEGSKWAKRSSDVDDYRARKFPKVNWESKTHTGHVYDELCKFFSFGNCQKGDDCIFAHSKDFYGINFKYCKYALVSRCTSEQCAFRHDIPCKFAVLSKECPGKSSCRFSHDKGIIGIFTHA